MVRARTLLLLVVFPSLATLLSACATSEDIPLLGAPDGAVPMDGSGTGGNFGSGGAAPGGGTSTGGVQGGGGAAGRGGSGNASGAAGAGGGACDPSTCPSCLITGLFGTTCCKSDGTCGCKALFGIGSCM